jgi:hypothetical protein
MADEEAQVIALIDFVRESNKIEGITRDPSDAEIIAHQAILKLDQLTVGNIVWFVDMVQPGAKLREHRGMNVQIGNPPVYVPPPGGTHIFSRLDGLLRGVNSGALGPYEMHQAYEALHPFMDGNGRSGRAIWLWQIGGIDQVPRGFLTTWYYQSLQHGGGR